MEDSRNIIKAIDALTLKAGGEAVDSKNITEAIDHLKAVYDQEAIGLDTTLSQEGLAADAKAVGDALNAIVKKITVSGTPDENGIVTTPLMISNSAPICISGVKENSVSKYGSTFEFTTDGGNLGKYYGVIVRHWDGSTRTGALEFIVHYLSF